MRIIHAALVISVVCVLSSGCARIRPPKGQKPSVRIMEVTGYCDCGKCCGWKRNWYGRPIDKSTGRKKRIGLTASGALAGRGTIAAPRNYPYGTIMHIDGYGYGRVEDRGGAIKGNRIDLFFPSHRKALEWGRKKNVAVKVWIPKNGE